MSDALAVWAVIAVVVVPFGCLCYLLMLYTWRLMDFLAGWVRGRLQ